MDILEAIGKRIREIRLEKHWTQEKLGEVIGVSYSYVGRIERGQKNISLQTLEKIAKALEVNEAEFFTYSHTEKLNPSEKMKEIQEINFMLYKQDLQSILRIKPVLQEMLKQMKKISAWRLPSAYFFHSILNRSSISLPLTVISISLKSIESTLSS